MVRRGGNFGQRRPIVLPGNNVTSTGDIDLRLIAASLDYVGLVHLKQFRMQRASIKLESEFSDFWANGQHG